ncbi:unnamed protein product [Paramecium octaurelia]|uniref:Uncharacterized protein n=1 Tax=Paramecium octaurelia TaxID=43137 RepID=A0A8S1VE97_PAROT|nr:unnamed protein product [Paramecium octaurelia]
MSYRTLSFGILNKISDLRKKCFLILKLPIQPIFYEKDRVLLRQKQEVNLNHENFNST